MPCEENLLITIIRALALAAIFLIDDASAAPRDVLVCTIATASACRDGACSAVRPAYPLVIIDRGWASTLWLLPSLFIRQINVDLFAVGASDGYAAGRHSAAGGALTLIAAMWVVPISLRYQIARRFTDDQALVHLIQLGL